MSPVRAVVSMLLAVPAVYSVPQAQTHPLTAATAGDSYLSTLVQIHTFPHWGTAEGLSFSDEGVMYQCDMWKVRSVNIETGAAIKENKEWGMTDVAAVISHDTNVVNSMTGSCNLGNMLYVLTWHSELILAYDSHTMELVRKIPVNLGGFGYGIAPSPDKSTLYITSLGPNGTSLLHMDPETFVVRKALPIIDPVISTRVSIVSEIEMVGDELWGNIDSYGPVFDGPDAPTNWGEDDTVVVSTINANRNDTAVQIYGQIELGEGSPCIVRINPLTGAVIGWVDASALLERYPEAPINQGAPVPFNGIAKDPVTGKLYVTGKYFNRLHEVGVGPSPVPEGALGGAHVRKTCNLAEILPIPGIGDAQRAGEMSSWGVFDFSYPDDYPDANTRARRVRRQRRSQKQRVRRG